MSELQYEIERRMHDVLAARDKQIEELCLEVRHLMRRAIAAEDRVEELTDLNARLAEPRVRPSDSTTYDEPTYGDY